METCHKLYCCRTVLHSRLRAVENCDTASAGGNFFESFKIYKEPKNG